MQHCSLDAINKNLGGDERRAYIHDCIEKAETTPDPQEAQVSSELGDKRPANKRELAAALAAVSKMLKDPDSAKLEDVNIRVRADGTGKICGKVNARNSFGGYVGFQAFIGDVQADGSVSIRGLDSPSHYASIAGDCYRIGL